jgi:hypothetical protein
MNAPATEIPLWLPPAVIDEAKELLRQFASTKNARGAGIFLTRLLTDQRMERVWRLLYKRKRNSRHESTKAFFHPAKNPHASEAALLRKLAQDLRNEDGRRNEARAKRLEAHAALEESLAMARPAAYEQDRAVRLFLRQACLSALNIRPVFRSDIQAHLDELNKIAAGLRSQAIALRAVEMEAQARVVDEIAIDCEVRRRILQPEKRATSRFPSADDPWIIERDRGDHRIRTYVVDISIVARELFGTPLYGQLATVANVVFATDKLTGQMVREWLR